MTMHVYNYATDEDYEYPTVDEMDEQDSRNQFLDALDTGYHDVLPDTCERCDGPFHFGATTVGGVWVCNDCEPQELAEHHQRNIEWFNKAAAS